MAQKQSSTGKSYRSAKTGRYVSKAAAKRSPSTTVGEARPGKGGRKKR